MIVIYLTSRCLEGQTTSNVEIVQEFLVMCFYFLTAALLHINVLTFSRSLIFCILLCYIKLTCSCKKTA